MKIGLDIMSGEKVPLSNIKGAINYLNNQISKDDVIFLYGNENILKVPSLELQFKFHSDGHGLFPGISENDGNGV